MDFQNNAEDNVGLRLGLPILVYFLEPWPDFR